MLEKARGESEVLALLNLRGIPRLEIFAACASQGDNELLGVEQRL